MRMEKLKSRSVEMQASETCNNAHAYQLRHRKENAQPNTPVPLLANFLTLTLKYYDEYLYTAENYDRRKWLMDQMQWEQMKMMEIEDKIHRMTQVSHGQLRKYIWDTRYRPGKDSAKKIIDGLNLKLKEMQKFGWLDETDLQENEYEKYQTLIRDRLLGTKWYKVPHEAIARDMLMDKNTLANVLKDKNDRESVSNAVAFRFIVMLSTVLNAEDYGKIKKEEFLYRTFELYPLAEGFTEGMVQICMDTAGKYIESEAQIPENINYAAAENDTAYGIGCRKYWLSVYAVLSYYDDKNIIEKRKLRPKIFPKVSEEVKTSDEVKNIPEILMNLNH